METEREEKETVMYCCRRESREALREDTGKFWYGNFHHHPRTAQICRVEGETIRKVVVRPAEEGDPSTYWGWWDRIKSRFDLVYVNRKMLSMAFPYGLRSAEISGKGEAIRVSVEDLGECSG
jgi:hypothetical protein